MNNRKQINEMNLTTRELGEYKGGEHAHYQKRRWHHELLTIQKNKRPRYLNIIDCYYFDDHRIDYKEGFREGYLATMKKILMKLSQYDVESDFQVPANKRKRDSSNSEADEQPAAKHQRLDALALAATDALATAEIDTPMQTLFGIPLFALQQNGFFAPLRPCQMLIPMMISAQHPYSHSIALAQSNILIELTGDQLQHFLRQIPNMRTTTPTIAAPIMRPQF